MCNVVYMFQIWPGGQLNAAANNFFPWQIEHLLAMICLDFSVHKKKKGQTQC